MQFWNLRKQPEQDISLQQKNKYNKTLLLEKERQSNQSIRPKANTIDNHNTIIEKEMLKIKEKKKKKTTKY